MLHIENDACSANHYHVMTREASLTEHPGVIMVGLAVCIIPFGYPPPHPVVALKGFGGRLGGLGIARCLRA